MDSLPEELQAGHISDYTYSIRVSMRRVGIPMYILILISYADARCNLTVASLSLVQDHRECLLAATLHTIALTICSNQASDPPTHNLWIQSHVQG